MAKYKPFKQKITTFREIADKAFAAGAPKERNIQGEVEPVKIRTIPVAWGVPFDEVMFSQFMVFFEGHANKMPWDGWFAPEGTYLEQARNEIHNKFLKSKYPYLMMLDSDIMFPKNLVEILMGYKLPIVGGWYRDKKAGDHHPCVYDFVNDEQNFSNFKHRDKPGTGLEKVDAMGAGCWLMTKETAVALGENPYSHKIAGGGEDFILCRKLLELKIPLHVDWNIRLAHLGVGHY